jgi:hypothetical protein
VATGSKMAQEGSGIVAIPQAPDPLREPVVAAQAAYLCSLLRWRERAAKIRIVRLTFARSREQSEDALATQSPVRHCRQRSSPVFPPTRTRCESGCENACPQA